MHDVAIASFAFLFMGCVTNLCWLVLTLLLAVLYMWTSREPLANLVPGRVMVSDGVVQLRGIVQPMGGVVFRLGWSGRAQKNAETKLASAVQSVVNEKWTILDSNQ